MVNRAKIKGTSAETAVVQYARSRGAIHAERRALNGAKDRGDLAGIPGFVGEIKNCNRIELGAWMAEAEAERINDNADLGVVIAKKRGTADVARWYACLPVAQLFDLLIAAGYIEKRTSDE